MVTDTFIETNIPPSTAYNDTHYKRKRTVCSLWITSISANGHETISKKQSSCTTEGKKSKKVE